MRRFVALGSLVALGAAFAACGDDGQQVKPHSAASGSGKGSSDSENNADPAPLSTSAPTIVDAGPPNPVNPIEGGAGGAATSYRGLLETTPKTRFGGKPYCSYDVTLSNIAIEIAVLPNGQVIGGSARETMVETTVAPCALQPAAPNEQSFSFTSRVETATGAQLAFEGANTNHPATRLVVDIQKVGDAYYASPIFVRTDQKPPLDWNVKAKLTLTPK